MNLNKKDIIHLTNVVKVFHLFARYVKSFKKWIWKKYYFSFFFPPVKRKLKEEWEEQQRKEKEEEEQKLQEKREREVIPVTGG